MKIWGLTFWTYLCQ